MSYTYYIGEDSSTAIQIYPGYDYDITEIKDESRHRSRGENLDATVYQWGYYTRIGFSLEYVPSSDTQQINEWWLDNTNIIFFAVDSANTCTSYNVRLEGNKRPLSKINKPYIDQYQGKLTLETYN